MLTGVQPVPFDRLADRKPGESSAPDGLAPLTDELAYPA